MSVGPLGGVPAGAAGAPLAQTSGSEVERSQQESSNQQRRTGMDAKAEAASGVARTDGEENQSHQRDADGRRLWEAPAQKQQKSEAESQPEVDPRQSKDTTGQSGNQLDSSA